MKNRRGVTLVEIVVAVTVLALLATVHAGVSIQLAKKNLVAASGINRSTALSTAVDLYTTMPYASLATNTGCFTISTVALYVHSRCVTVTNPTSAITRVMIIIIPANAAFRRDTVRVDRSLPTTAGSIFS